MKRKNGKLTPFGKLVVKALTDQDMTRTQLADTIGTSPQYLSYILYGVRSGEKYVPGNRRGPLPRPPQGREGHRSITAGRRERGVGRVHRSRGGRSL